MAKKPIPLITLEIEERFWARVDKSPGHGPKGDCWVWTGPRAFGGYPKHVVIKGVRYRGGHVSLFIAGMFPTETKTMALHSCDYPPCVRPDHLRWGSQLDNIKDAAERGTAGRRGFTPDEVRHIRSSPLRHFELAKQYKTSCACIMNIRKRVSHKHVD